jgi:hypothetical protein
MRPWPNNPYLLWFRLVLWVGVLANLIFCVLAVFNPSGLLALLGLPPAHPLIWLQDAGGLLFLLSVMNFPAGIDPFRYRVNAVVSVLGRLVFGVFWFWQVLFADYPRAFLQLAFADTGFGVVLGILYLLLLRYEYLRPERPDGP